MTADEPLAGLLLAAGAGVRLGTPKALVSVGGQPLVVRGVQMLADAGCRWCVVVVGARAEQVRAAVASADPEPRAEVELVTAPEWDSGQSHSLRTGLEQLTRRGAAAAIVALVDQPLVTAAAVERLVVAWRSGARAAVSTFDGQQMPPVLLDAAVWPDVVASLEGDEGAGPWLRSNAALTTPVEVGDIADGRDVDTPEQLVAVNLIVGRTPWP